VRIVRGREVVGFTQDADGVAIDLSDDTTLRAQHLVRCDGGRSRVRSVAGIDFPGTRASASWMIAEVEMDEEPDVGVRPEGGGIGPVDRVHGGSPYGVVLRDEHVEPDAEPTLEDRRAALVAKYGTDGGLDDRELSRALTTWCGPAALG
jgi:2-polyprenyl-6-methoxyphenol hydroxylase-like FAD-dependent oxidoreductase